MLRTYNILHHGAIFGAISLCLLSCGEQSETTSQSTNSETRLAVVLVVDQMRADYLKRWSNMYSGGLHRLIEKGAMFTNACHDHASTVTAAGHATIATGVVPARHGIVGNSFYVRQLGRIVSSVADSATEIVGGKGGRGASPRRLERTTLGDWLKQVSPESKVFAASLKDRAAIFMGGKAPDGVFWYDKRSGDFVTSSYYEAALPAWVTSFNSSGAKDAWQDSIWTATWTAVDPDASTLNEESSEEVSAFSHVLSGETASGDYYRTLYEMPYADALLISFCLDLLSSEHLGEDAAPDLFMISLSAADLVGHEYGPDSQEIMDYYLRLDLELGMFMDSLDARIGNDGYVLVLSSDHGVCPIPEVAVEHGLTDYRRLLVKDYKEDVARAMTGEFSDHDQSTDFLTSVYNGFLIDSSASEQYGLSMSAMETRAASALMKIDYVSNVFTFAQLSADSIIDLPYIRLFRNSFVPDRSPDLIVNFKEGVLLSSSTTGTSHGTPYHYDTNVPIVFYGNGIRPMVDDDSVRTVDIAPTVSALLNITSETELDGRILPVTEQIP